MFSNVVSSCFFRYIGESVTCKMSVEHVLHWAMELGKATLRKSGLNALTYGKLWKKNANFKIKYYYTDNIREGMF